MVAWLLLGGSQLSLTGGWWVLLLAGGLVGTVLSAVHHTEVVAHMVGEPYGTLVLALAITVMEVALISQLTEEAWYNPQRKYSSFGQASICAHIKVACKQFSVGRCSRHLLRRLGESPSRPTRSRFHPRQTVASVLR